MKVLIIEDEIPAVKRLIRLLTELREDIDIVGTADSIEEACELFEKHKVDLAFMDIQLADGQSFRIFEKVTVNCPVVFTTAYDEFALKAFKVNSVDYLLKPIEEKQLEDAMLKYESHFKQSSQESDVQTLMKLMADKRTFRKRFLIKVGNKLSFVSVDDVAFFLSEASTTFLVTKDNQRFIIDQTLDELEQEVNPDDFFRINRKFLIHIGCIERMEAYFNNRLLLHTQPNAGEEVVVSRQRTREFKLWMDS